MPEESIAVLGTGWLGLPLVRALSDEYTVRGSYRRSETRDAIAAVGGLPFPIDLPDNAGALRRFLDGTGVLTITLPPGGRSHGERTTDIYLRALSPLRGLLRKRHVIYTSSTGVYGSKTSGRVTEEAPLAPDTHSSRAVAAAEQWLGEHCDRLTILRLAGLIGPGRDPVHFFRKRDAIPRGDAPVNLIELNQVIAAIRLIHRSRITGIFNVCAGEHPTKKEFYGNLLQQAGLPPKSFLPGGANSKCIDSSKLRQLGWPDQ